MRDFNSKLAEIKTEVEKSTPARERLAYLYDEGSFTELDAYVKSGDALSGVITAYGYVDGNPVYAFSQDVTVKNGAMTCAQAKKIKKVYDLAAKTGIPVVGIYDSFGADMNNPVCSLSAYGELLMWSNNLSGVVPQISVVAGTCAGTATMLAQSADFVVMSKDAEMFITPNTNIKNLAENSAKSGTACAVCENDKEAVEFAKNILLKFPQNNLSPVPMYEFDAPATAFGKDAENMIKAVADAETVVELNALYGKASYTALASVGGATVGFVATNKTEDKLTSADCSKIARFVRTCDAFAIPVVTIVDTEGFETNDEAEMQGAVKDMTKLAHAYAEATTIKLAVIAGKAYGPAYIALAGKGANADLTFALPEAVISPVNPLTAAEFMSHDELKGAENVDAKRNELADEFINNNASAVVCAAKGAVDAIVEAGEVRNAIVNAIEIMAGKRISKLPKKHGNMPL
ncbi:MAG: carboxyl transferase [Oscillospiraceae bacterium]|nr:carboxyl transferase [Oscillospiraceae bacterium]